MCIGNRPGFNGSPLRLYSRVAASSGRWPLNSVLVLISGGTESGATMWRLVPALTLVSLALVTAAPQQRDDMDSYMDQVFHGNTSPQSVQQIGGEIIQEPIPSITNSTLRTTLGKDNQQNAMPTDCECVPYFQCTESIILSDYIRGPWQCENYLDVCCKPSNFLEKITPPSTDKIA